MSGNRGHPPRSRGAAAGPCTPRTGPHRSPRQPPPADTVEEFNLNQLTRLNGSV